MGTCKNYTVFVDGELEIDVVENYNPNTRVEIPDEGIFIVKEMKSDENDLNKHDA